MALPAANQANFLNRLKSLDGGTITSNPRLGNPRQRLDDGKRWWEGPTLDAAVVLWALESACGTQTIDAAGREPHN